MNYKLSQKILGKIKDSENILVNCHTSPDPDSLGSALAMYIALKKLGKDVEIVCPDNIPDDSKFLPFSEKIKKIKFAKFDFSKYDLFLVLDSAGENMITGISDGKLPNIYTVVIDHHKTNKNFGNINLVDVKVSSCAELIYKLFQDWGIKLDTQLATNLLTGILGDTGIFEYPGVGVETLGLAGKLMELGADKDEIVLNIFRTEEFKNVKFWGEILKRMEIDAEGKFVWSAVSYDVYNEYGKPGGAKDAAAGMFLSLVKGTDFGMIMLEEEKKTLAVSFRSRTGLDVAEIAVELGGGGHKAAAGAKIYGLEFDSAVLKVLGAARKYARKAS
ncbi:bifunctional oligoribonuclease/PAP phosphatase NrnA [Patescibacteria group bacterium]|nr:bifunctional oligoribonuclease/PAP phosphatase NrnA [Patescibacteria group bacterium]